MTEVRLFEEGTVPEYTTPQWYLSREHAPHLEQSLHHNRLVEAASHVNRYCHLHLEEGVSVVDLGCGDGGLLSLLDPKIHAWGYDLQPTNVSAAFDRKVDVRYGSIFDDDLAWGKVAVITECLEHLVDPHAFVRRIAEHCDAIVASSPNNEHDGAHYEFHTWAWDHEGYSALLQDNGFPVVQHHDVDMFHVVVGAKTHIL